MHGGHRAEPRGICRGRARAEAQVEIARKTDDKYSLAKALAQTFWIYRDKVDLRRAGSAAEEVQRIRPFDPRGPYLLAELARAREQWDVAAKLPHEAKQLVRSGNDDRAVEVSIAIASAEAAVGTGRPAEGLRALDEIGPLLARSRHVPLQIRARACRLGAQALQGACPASSEVKDLLAGAHGLGCPRWSKA
jgi:hypothetical protein